MPNEQCEHALTRSNCQKDEGINVAKPILPELEIKLSRNSLWPVSVYQRWEEALTLPYCGLCSPGAAQSFRICRGRDHYYLKPCHDVFSRALSFPNNPPDDHYLREFLSPQCAWRSFSCLASQKLCKALNVATSMATSLAIEYFFLNIFHPAPKFLLAISRIQHYQQM